MKIHGVLSVFNEATTLRGALESMSPFVDDFIIVDGAYAKFPNTGKNGASNDGTLELIKQLQLEWQKPIKLIECPGRPWETEMEKRTAYFDAMQVGEWMIMLDADERLAFGGEILAGLEGRAEIRPFDCGVLIFRFIQENGNAHYGTCARVYKKKPGTKYGNGHAHVIYDGGYRWSTLQLPIVIEHFDFIRPKERNEQRLEFYKSGNMR